jgi:phosphoglycerol transferase MdoB-like AlkP superfamily enzyme
MNNLKKWWLWVRPFAVAFLAIQLLVRIFLATYGHAWHEMSIVNVIEVFGLGLIYDIQVLGFFMVPVLLYGLCVNPKNWSRRRHTIARAVIFVLYAYLWLFTAVGEYFFWQEFTTRYNFIAVDYLVYTTEVIGNIQQSYPVYPILSANVIIALVLAYIFRNCLRLPSLPKAKWYRSTGLALVILPFLFLNVITNDWSEISDSQKVNELSMNGTYNLFSAFRNNELDYKKFYLTRDEKDVTGHIRELLQEKDFVSKDPNDITRLIKANGPEIHKNVIFVVMESMSGDYMGRFGNKKNLTPNLDRLSKESLFFSNLYATGTRTVRGLEAVSLSIPPTPGQSIVRRPGNDGLFSLGYVFKDRGYDTKFIYGGHGYFDNMNAFFGANGFDIYDRTMFPADAVTFSNVWGVCDEDLFNQVIATADKSVASGHPFMDVVMTTSNHRPYTYPDGKIDISSHEGRNGGVKYADYAVGDFLAKAKKKSWYKNTIFIFVADHTAGAAGKIELSPQRYHIPAMIYAPGFVKTQDYSKISSQIDLGPTVLGLLNFSYYTKFFGNDLLKYKGEPYAFVSNYQKVGLLRKDKLVLLEPKRMVEEFQNEEKVPDNAIDQDQLRDAVTFYQFAAGWKDRMKTVSSVFKQEAK